MLQPQSKRPGERARAFLTRADVRDALRCLLLALIGAPKIGLRYIPLRYI